MHFGEIISLKSIDYCDGPNHEVSRIHGGGENAVEEAVAVKCLPGTNEYVGILKSGINWGVAKRRRFLAYSYSLRVR